MKTEQLSAIDQIKAEFQERWGVDVKIELSVNRLDDEKAKRIVEEYTGTSYMMELEDINKKRYSNEDPNDRYHTKEGYSIITFTKELSKEVLR